MITNFICAYIIMACIFWIAGGILVYRCSYDDLAYYGNIGTDVVGLNNIDYTGDYYRRRIWYMLIMFGLLWPLQLVIMTYVAYKCIKARH